MACIIAACCFSPLSLALLPTLSGHFLVLSNTHISAHFCSPQLLCSSNTSSVSIHETSHARHSHLECQKSPSHTITHLVINQSPLSLSDSCYRLSSCFFSLSFSCFRLTSSRIFLLSARSFFLNQLTCRNLHLQRERERDWEERWAVCCLRDQRKLISFFKAELTQKREEVFFILEEKRDPYLCLEPKQASEMKTPTS